MKQIEWEVLGTIRACGPLHFKEVRGLLLSNCENKEEWDAITSAMENLLMKRLVWADHQHCDVTELGRIAFETECNRRKGRKAKKPEALDTLKRRQATWGELS